MHLIHIKQQKQLHKELSALNIKYNMSNSTNRGVSTGLWCWQRRNSNTLKTIKRTKHNFKPSSLNPDSIINPCFNNINFN